MHDREASIELGAGWWAPCNCFVFVRYLRWTLFKGIISGQDCCCEFILADSRLTCGWLCLRWFADLFLLHHLLLYTLKLVEFALNVVWADTYGWECIAWLLGQRGCRWAWSSLIFEIDISYRRQVFDCGVNLFFFVILLFQLFLLAFNFINFVMTLFIFDYRVAFSGERVTAIKFFR